MHQTTSSALAWPKTSRIFLLILQLLPWPCRRWAEVLAIRPWYGTGWAEPFDYTQKVRPWLGPIWAELFANCKKFCPGLVQDGQNFLLYAKSSALAGPKMGRTFGDVLKVLPWPRPKIDRTSCYTQQFLSLLGLRWAKLLTIYQKFRPGLAQEGQNFLQYTKTSALAWPKIDRTSCTIPKVLPWPGPRQA